MSRVPFPQIFSRRASGALIGVAVLLTAACGGSDSSADTAASTTSAVTGSGVEAVVAAAQAFADSLDDDQSEQAMLEMTAENAQAWSNLPCGQTCRGGVAFSDLDDDQLTLAKTLLQTAIGTGDDGYTRVENIWAADDELASLQASGEGGGPGSSSDGAMPSGGTMPSGDAGMPTDMAMPSGDAGMPSGGAMPSGDASGGPGGDASGGGGLGGYGSDLYDLALLGDPSTDGDWMLHFGGHHLAVNFTYSAGEVVGASPYFLGVEPTSWTADDGTEYAPLEDMHDAVTALATSLDTAQKKTAKLDSTFSDVLLGPGEDGNFPDTKEGIKVSELDDDQQQLVLEAMQQWVSIADDDVAADMMATYEDELDDTYVGWSGGVNMDEHANYLRIDGPSVWIEFVCQNGVVLSDQIHYHTVWRDHTRDYGGEFSS